MWSIYISGISKYYSLLFSLVAIQRLKREEPHLSMDKLHRMCLGISISMSRWDCDCSIWYAGENQL